MTLETLIREMDVVGVTGDTMREVSGLAYDSRRVRNGDAFFALAGAKQDGARFVSDAVRLGATAVVSAPGVAVDGVPHVTVSEPRLALAQAAGTFHGHPSRTLRVVSVTGTNGKTTTTWMLESIFRVAGWSAGVIGTTGVRWDGKTRSSSFTTPESPELQALLAEMVADRVEAVAMEVSSHALVQRRAWGLATDVCVFTNLTQDHLDYHGSMEAYFDAKQMLFDGRNGGSGKTVTAVVNAGDAHAARVIESARRGGARVRTFALGGPTVAAGIGFHVGVERVVPRGDGMDLTIRIDAPAGGASSVRSLRLPMLGTFNALNAAGAYAASLALELAPDTIERGLSMLPGVPGRLERIEAGQVFAVAVDYAHTPDALERALAAVREHATGRVLVVFGCGGDRDRGKRPRMGAAAARLADAVWITSDNPRSEDPAAIVAEVAAGAAGARVLHLEIDRRIAIGAALAEARAGDVVLVAGKGHETTQTLGDQVLPFDDREVVREWLRSGGVA